MKRGFTLIELLVVLSIISLLSSIGLAALNTTRAKARDAKRVSDIYSFRRALELYYNDYGQYPPSNLSFPAGEGWALADDPNWGQNWNLLMVALQPYLSSYLKEPLTPSLFPGGMFPEVDLNAYGYVYYSNPMGTDGPCPNQWYMIVYRLEKSVVPNPGIETCEPGYRVLRYTHAPGVVTVGTNAGKEN